MGACPVFGERIKQGELGKKRDVKTLRSWGPRRVGSIHSTPTRTRVKGKNTSPGCAELVCAGDFFGSNLFKLNFWMEQILGAPSSATPCVAGGVSAGESVGFLLHGGMLRGT